MCGSNGSLPPSGLSLVEFGQFGRAIRRLGVEMEIVPGDAVDHEPEGAPREGLERGPQRSFTRVGGAEHQREVRADHRSLRRVILRPQAAQGGVVGFAQDRPADDIEHAQP
jgi:hypothetical protein